MTREAVGVIASAVFDKPVAQVLEAYSEYDQEPRQLPSAEELAQYISQKLATPRGSAFFFVVYLDMEGRAERKVIYLDQKRVRRHQLRYTWNGWGLISVILERGDNPSQKSRITANSEKRALKWMSTAPEWAPPRAWNWKAVKSHTRRLQRVLKQLPNKLLEPTLETNAAQQSR